MPLHRTLYVLGSALLIAAPAAAASSISASPGSLSLTAQTGHAGSPRIVTVSNHSAKTIDLGQLAFIGANAADFGLQSGGDFCSNTALAAHTKCSVQINDLPSEVAGTTDYAQLQIPSSTGAIEATVNLTLHVKAKTPFAVVIGSAAGFYILLTNSSNNPDNLDDGWENIAPGGTVTLPSVPGCTDYFDALSQCYFGPFYDPNGHGGVFQLYVGGGHPRDILTP